MAEHPLRQVPRVLPPGRSRSAQGRAGGAGAAPVRRGAQTSHELLLEIIPSRSGAPTDDATLARALDRIYALGVFPDWWKLPDPGAIAWAAIAATIERRDPYCRGVLLLGLDAPPAEIEASFELAARQPVCKGFAIGRTIFGAPARAWMRGEIDDATAIAAHGCDLRGPDRGLAARVAARGLARPPTDRARGRFRVPEMVKFAVLGCGRIGRMHALNLARHPRAELSYVYDVADQAAAATAEATGARRAGAIDEILERARSTRC